MSRTWQGGSTRAWRKTRQHVLERDGHRCRAHTEGHCDAPGVAPHACAGTATHAHHVRGKAYGDDPRHIIAACEACNLAIGQPGRADPAPRSLTRW